MADVTFIVDGKTLTAPAGTLLIDACRKAGIEIPGLLLLSRAEPAGGLPHVRGAPGEGGQAADGLHHHGGRGTGLHHRVG